MNMLSKLWRWWVVAFFVSLPSPLLFAAGRQSSPEDKPPSANRLINEKSPYLLQHAHNPVDWYPWGEKAFAKARKENKLIFLSIGYSTCHWCHVMERESYSDPEIAKVMNANFVNIKVDREERPDIDSIYMAFVVATTGNGGWPMNVWLTPELRPFVGGTYFPARGRDGAPVFKNVLLQVAGEWEKRHDRIIAVSKEITSRLQTFVQSGNSPKEKVSRETLKKAYEELAKSFDRESGGFGGAPKFPQPVVLNLLFRIYAAAPESSDGKHALDMALFTLRKMAAGGIHDHLGGGFHRYSVDSVWHVPHFEKMLYDQAQLATAYLDASQITGDAFFATTARDILDYVQRDMTGPESGFYSAEDADSLVRAGKSDRAEGAFYVWEKDEVDHVLGPDGAKIFDYIYGIEAKGNAYESDTSGELVGKNVLIERHSLGEAAKEFNLKEDQVRQSLEASRKLLLEARNQRPRPNRDDKVVTSWNGLMISAFARGARVLNEPGYLKTATEAAQFVETKLYQKTDHSLQRTYREGESKINGFSDDYAFFIQGLLDLYEASFDTRWLELATTLQERQNALFWDREGAAYFTTSGQDPNLLLRTKGDYDGAEPLANSVSALNLVRLSWFFENNEWRKMAEQTIDAFEAELSRSALSLAQMLVALDALEAAPKQVVIAGKWDCPDTQTLLREVNHRYQPNAVSILADGGSGQAYFNQKIEFLKEVHPIDNKATAYVCENFVCQLPTNDLAVMTRLLDTKVATERNPPTQKSPAADNTKNADKE
jgi:uncharacterized protein